MTAISWIGRRRLSFAVESVLGRDLSGWVFARDAPLRRVWVAVETNDGPPSFDLADTYRADVHRADIGSDGYCGFSISIAALHTVDFRLVSLEPRRLLAKRQVNEQKPVARCSEIGNLLFRLDPTEGRLSGWLSSSDDPDARRRLRLMLRGRPAYEQTACLFRRDAPAGARDALHGFSIPLPRDHGEIELIDVTSGQCLHARR